MADKISSDQEPNDGASPILVNKPRQASTPIDEESNRGADLANESSVSFCERSSDSSILRYSADKSSSYYQDLSPEKRFKDLLNSGLFESIAEDISTEKTDEAEIQPFEPKRLRFSNESTNISFQDLPSIHEDVPPNTPDVSKLEEKLIAEAMRQEEIMKKSLESHILFKSDDILIPQGKRDDDSEKVEDKKVEPETRTNVIVPYEDTRSLNSKETQRKKRTMDSLEALKKLVPGLNENSEEKEVYEMTAKYIEFMKKYVSPDFDKSFLMKQIM